MKRRSYHDPLHGEIVLDSNDPAEAMVIALIDAPAFQRLRRIRQLGPAFLTFHGAESSRFTHSIGVLHLARRALQHLERLTPELADYRGLIYGAALIHDRLGIPIIGAWEPVSGNTFIWIRSFDNEAAIATQEAAYFASPERQALGSQPQALILATRIELMRSTRSA